MLERALKCGATLEWLADYAQTIMRLTQSSALEGEADCLPLERQWSRPTLDVHGFSGGFTGEGVKTVIDKTVGLDRDPVQQDVGLEASLSGAPGRKMLRDQLTHPY